MAMKTSTNGSLQGTVIPSLAMKEVLYRAPAFERFDAACEKRKIPSQTTNSIIVRRWINPAVNSNPEPEGVTPVFRALVGEDYTGTLQRYSEVFATTRYDFVLDPWNAVEGSADVLADLVKSTQERIRMLAAFSGSNVLYNSSAIASRVTVNGPITKGRIQKGTVAIGAAKGRTFTQDQSAVDKFNTTAIESGYYMFHHTNMQPDIRAIPDVILLPQMAERRGLPAGTWAATEKCIFVEQPEIPILTGAGGTNSLMFSTGAAVDVYQSFLCAKGALLSVGLEGSGKEGFGNMKIEVLDKADKSDPTNTRVLVSAAWMDLCMNVSNDWGVRYETGATANPA